MPNPAFYRHVAQLTPAIYQHITQLIFSLFTISVIVNNETYIDSMNMQAIHLPIQSYYLHINVLSIFRVQHNLIQTISITQYYFLHHLNNCIHSCNYYNVMNHQLREILTSKHYHSNYTSYTYLPTFHDQQSEFSILSWICQSKLKCVSKNHPRFNLQKK